MSEIVKHLLLASQLAGKLRINIEPCDPLERFAQLEIERHACTRGGRLLRVKSPQSCAQLLPEQGRPSEYSRTESTNAITFARRRKVTIAIEEAGPSRGSSRSAPPVWNPRPRAAANIREVLSPRPRNDRGIGGRGSDSTSPRVVRRVNGREYGSSRSKTRARPSSRGAADRRHRTAARAGTAGAASAAAQLVSQQLQRCSDARRHERGAAKASGHAFGTSARAPNAGGVKLPRRPAHAPIPAAEALARTGSCGKRSDLPGGSRYHQAAPRRRNRENAPCAG